ncbi:Transposase (plasmid) [Nostoc flagelliforme CCNUN1]|uniref:Transposase n=1 Tax=Nostoc flagelliforme CCNUN1 TaxID=2038116 RepID=A0A2K8T6W7_9NOSO|nr:IS982 family transposase [Nostoc flagelliforme]AUB43448.1 Transposase [Nostoc flagelliforme CCNUN1]
MELEKLFCDVDDFCSDFEKKWQRELLATSDRKRHKKFNLCLSEVMTIIIYFHQSSYRNFKDYYTKHVCTFFDKYFPNLVSYNRFVELKKSALIPLCWYLHLRRGQNTGINFVDSTSLEICLNQRAKRNRVFKELANWGKSSLGWYFGFKLHLIINEFGEILSFMITPANVDDRKPVPEMTKNLFGKLFGDRGYISHKLFELLFQQNLQLITTIKKNMKNRLMPLIDKILLRKRSLIETVNDQLKNISQIQHTRHRSVCNFMVNVIAGIIAYTYQDKKPSLNLTIEDLDSLQEADFLPDQTLALAII